MYVHTYVHIHTCLRLLNSMQPVDLHTYVHDGGEGFHLHIFTGTCVHWPLCSLTPVFTGPCVHWPLCSLTPVFTGPCVHWPLCSLAPVFTGPCVHWPLCSLAHAFTLIVLTFSFVSPSLTCSCISVCSLVLI